MAIGKTVAGLGIGLSVVAGICMPLAGLGYGAYLGFTAGAAALGVTNVLGAGLIACGGAVLGAMAGKVAAGVTIIGGSALSGVAGAVVGAVSMTVKGIASGISGLFTSKNKSVNNTLKTPVSSTASTFSQKSSTGDFAQSAKNDNQRQVEKNLVQKLSQDQGWKR